MGVAELQDDTIAALLDRLGGVPASRVLLSPPPGTATEADVLTALGQPRQRFCELIDGTLVEKAMGTHEAILSSYLAALMWAFVRQHDLGIVMGGDGPVRLMPGNVRYPDVSFIPWELVPENANEEKIWSVTQPLAVEVVSESNTEAEIDRKLKDLFSTGCKLAWIIDPRCRMARVHTAPDVFDELDETGTLDGAPVLSGFAVSLAELFAGVSRPKKPE